MGHGGLRRAQKVEVRFRDASADVTVHKRASDGVTLEEDPTSLKKAKLELAQGMGPVSGQLSVRAAGTVQTRYRGTKGNCRSGWGF